MALPADAIGRVTGRAVVPGHAVAGEVVTRLWIRHVYTGRAVLARLVLAGDQPETFAQFAGELIGTLTPEQTWQIHAYAIVLTRAQRYALVDVAIASVNQIGKELDKRESRDPFLIVGEYSFMKFISYYYCDCVCACSFFSLIS